MVGMGMPEWLAQALVDMYTDMEKAGDQPVSPVVRETTGQTGRSFEAFVREHRSAFHGATAEASH
jgi:hypothetical protein